jgi:predicted NBD/HSP70 family sugar kinase
VGFLSSVQDVAAYEPSSLGPLEARISGAALERHGDPRELFERARAGDDRASEIVRSVAEGLGVAAANLFALLDPELVVLGGWVPREQDLLLDRAREVAARLAPGGVAPIVLATLGDDAALLGAINIARRLVRERRDGPGGDGSTTAAREPTAGA